jgi:hypothetical protein
MSRLGEAVLDTTPSATTHGLYPMVLSARHRRLRRPRWETAGHGGAGEELLGATPLGAAGRRPNKGCGPRAAAEAVRHNVTKPLFRLILRKEYRRAVGTHYGSTRIRQAAFSLCHRRDGRAGTTILLTSLASYYQTKALPK